MFPVIGFSEEQEINVVLNGEKLQFAVPPVNVDGRILVPYRKIAEALDAKVHWDSATRTVTAAKGAESIRFTLGDQAAYVNGKRIELDVPGQLIRGYTVVPIRFVGESLGAKVEWIGDLHTVYIFTGDYLSIAPEAEAEWTFRTLNFLPMYYTAAGWSVAAAGNDSNEVIGTSFNRNTRTIDIRLADWTGDFSHTIAELPQEAWSVTIDPDVKHIAWTDGNGFYMKALGTEETYSYHYIEGEVPPAQLLFSPDGTKAVVIREPIRDNGIEQYEVLLWEEASGAAPPLASITGENLRIFWSPDGEKLLVHRIVRETINTQHGTFLERPLTQVLHLKEE